MWRWLCWTNFRMIWNKFWLFIKKKPQTNQPIKLQKTPPTYCYSKILHRPSLLAFTHILPFLSSSILWRNDDFAKLLSFLKFESRLSLQKTRLILPAENTKFLKWLAKWIMLNGRNYTLGMWTAKKIKAILITNILKSICFN